MIILKLQTTYGIVFMDEQLYFPSGHEKNY